MNQGQDRDNNEQSFSVLRPSYIESSSHVVVSRSDYKDDLMEPLHADGAECTAPEPPPQGKRCHCRDIAFFGAGALTVLVACGCVGAVLYSRLQSGSGAEPDAGHHPPAEPVGLSVDIEGPSALTYRWRPSDETANEWEVQMKRYPPCQCWPAVAWLCAPSAPPDANLCWILCSEGSAVFSNVNLDDGGISWMYPATGLKGETDYCFRVRAGNQYNFSRWSGVICNKTSHGIPPTATEAPILKGYKCTSPGDKDCSLSLSPGAIDDTGGADITRIDCAVRRCRQTALGASLQCESSKYPATAAGDLCLVEQADQDTMIQVRTAAVNRWGAGNTTEPITCIVLPQQPLFCNRKEKAEVPAITGLAISSTGSDRALLTWTMAADGTEGEATQFEIQRDDWWSGTSFATVGNANSSQSFLVQGLLPATTYHYRVRAIAGVQHNQGPWSEVVSGTTANAGACGDSHNLPAQKAHFSSLKATVQWCLLTALGNAARAASCITNKVGFTEACAMCWIHEGQCAAAQCLVCLKDPSGQPCEDCAIKKCFPPLIQCTGLPISADPMR